MSKLEVAPPDTLGITGGAGSMAEQGGFLRNFLVEFIFGAGAAGEGFPLYRRRVITVQMQERQCFILSVKMYQASRQILAAAPLSRYQDIVFAGSQKVDRFVYVLDPLRVAGNLVDFRRLLHAEQAGNRILAFNVLDLRGCPCCLSASPTSGRRRYSIPDSDFSALEIDPD
jgi:hypothetical protein